MKSLPISKERSIEILEELKKGNVHNINELCEGYLQYAKRIARIYRKVCRDPNQVESIAYEAVLDCLLKIAVKMEFQGTELLPYIKASIRSKITNFKVREKVKNINFNSIPDTRRDIDSDFISLLMKCALTDQQKKILQLRIEGKIYEEIKTELNLSMRTIFMTIKEIEQRFMEIWE